MSEPNGNKGNIGEHCKKISVELGQPDSDKVTEFKFKFSRSDIADIMQKASKGENLAEMSRMQLLKTVEPKQRKELGELFNHPENLSLDFQLMNQFSSVLVKNSTTIGELRVG